VCQVSGSRAVNSKDWQDSEMTSTNRIERKGSRETSRERNVRKKDASKQTASNRKGCQDSKMSRANRITREWHHQTKMSRERNVKEKGLQDVPRDGAVNGHDSQGVRRRSYKLSPFFIGFPPCRNFRHPACPGSTGMDDIECI
jgi:hypothetical protein